MHSTSLWGVVLVLTCGLPGCHVILPLAPAAVDAPPDSRTDTAVRDAVAPTDRRAAEATLTDQAAADVAGSDVAVVDGTPPTDLPGAPDGQPGDTVVITPDGLGPLDACALGYNETALANNVAACRPPTLVLFEQCDAAALCEATAWHLCTASDYLAYVAKGGVGLSGLWLASCIRDGAAAPITTPSDSACSVCTTKQSGASQTYRFPCSGGSSLPAGSNNEYVGVTTYIGCFGLGPSATSAVESLWNSRLTAGDELGALCCKN